MNALEFIPTADLVREVLRRFDHAVVAVMRIGEGGPGKQSHERLWKGNPHTAAGLCADLQYAIMEMLRSEEAQVGPGDLGGES